MVLMAETVVGFRIFSEWSRPDRSEIERFRGIPSSNINDVMHRLYCMSGLLSPRNIFDSMVGTAFTVKVPVGDNLMIHKALDMAKTGDILVIDGAGALERSLAGPCP
jgi:regulator of RNase E activity RraA